MAVPGLRVAGLPDRPARDRASEAVAGDIRIGGASCVAISDEARTRLRRSEIGFVYQFHHLLPEFTAIENVMLPQMIAGVPRARAGRLRRGRWGGEQPPDQGCVTRYSIPASCVLARLLRFGGPRV